MYIESDVKHRLWLAAALGALMAGPALGACQIDDARLLDAGNDPSNWIMAGHDYTNQHFSGLTGITKENVDRLAPRWIFQSGVTGTFQTEPLVLDGVMYATTTLNDVVALDAATGKEIWRYEHEPRTDKKFGGPSNRGAALAYGKVFQATIDGRVIALDCATGKVVWDKTMVKPEKGESESLKLLGAAGKDFALEGVSRLGYKMPPLIAHGQVIVGVTGAGFDLHYTEAGSEGDVVTGGGGVIGVEGGFGRRGFLSAIDADTGKETWRWHTTKKDGWEGSFSETTPGGVLLNRDIPAERAAAERFEDAWKVGGGSMWMRPAYDPESGLIYAGTGNPSPQNYGASRPGDNLYTSGVAAVSVADGSLDWFFQQVPHNIWGYEQAAPPFLVDLDGRTVVGAGSKVGWLYVNDAETGKLVFKSDPLVDFKNLFEPSTPEGTVVRPGPGGAVSWHPTSVDPRSDTAYVQVRHSSGEYSTREAQLPSGERTRYVQTTGADDASWSTLTAVDLSSSGNIKWKTRTDSKVSGGTLATASGLVFSGEANGMFKAYNAETGEELWSFNAGVGISGPPISYEVDGVQYVAVPAGGTALFQREGAGVGDDLIVFALVE